MTQAHPLEARVRAALGRNREPGWHFPGHFLAVSFDEMQPDACRMHLDLGPHCTGPDGEVDAVSLGIFMDLGLAAIVRTRLPHDHVRLATISLQAQFAGVPGEGPLQAQGSARAFTPGGMRVMSAELAISDASGLVCQGSGLFMVLPAPEGFKAAPLGSADPASLNTPLPVANLTPAERVVHQAALRALAGPQPFAQRFWGLRTRAVPQGAWSRLAIRQHVANRVGHAHGGVLWGQAAQTVLAAVPAGWRIGSLMASYLRPGTAPATLGRAQVLHQGRSTAAVRIEILDRERQRVLEGLATLVAGPGG